MKHLKYFEKYVEPTNDSMWVAISTDYNDDEYIYLDAWETLDNEEEGEVIAKINVDTDQVIYLDDRAKTDSYAQDVINNVISENKELRFKIITNKFNV